MNRKSAALFSSQSESNEFARSLRAHAVGKQLQFFPVTESTNDLALAAARAGGEHGAVFVADHQHKGRGRRGRQWESPPGLSLLFSVLLRPRGVEPEKLGWVPLLAGLACAEAIRAHCGIPAGIKWPNDIVLPCKKVPGWRKLGGVLCESALSAGDPDPSYVVVGIGVNVNQSARDFPKHTKAPPGSLRSETGKSQSRQAVFKALLENLDRRLQQLGDATLKDDVEAALSRWWSPKKRLRLQLPGEPDRTIEGTFAGLDAFGRLRVSVAGKIENLADAEVVAVS